MRRARPRKAAEPAVASCSDTRRGFQRIEQHRAALEGYERLCDELGADPADVALAWLLAQPAVTAPVIGPRTVDQFTDSLGALDVTLPADALAKLDDLFPGPGGPAPEAYTW